MLLDQGHHTHLREKWKINTKNGQMMITREKMETKKIFSNAASDTMNHKRNHLTMNLGCYTEQTAYNILNYGQTNFSLDTST
jgi:hypothetical protein